MGEKEIKDLLVLRDYAAKMVFLATMANQSLAFLASEAATEIAVKTALMEKLDLQRSTKKATAELKEFPAKWA